MGYTIEEIKDLPDPYTTLGNSDAIAENLIALNKLSPEDKISVATKIIQFCPKEELKGFWHVVDAARKLSGPDDTFHQVLSQAYEVKKRIVALDDPQNTHPHHFLLDQEFDAELYDQFNNLALSALAGNELKVAQRLAITTPADKRSKLCANVNNVFPNSDFGSLLGSSFALCREIESKLLSTNPETFFTSDEMKTVEGDFSVDLCNQFSGVFPKYLAGKEQTIGERLADIECKELRSQVARDLNLMNPKASDANNCFRLIAQYMSAKIEAKPPVIQDPMPPQQPAGAATTSANHPSSLFGQHNHQPAINENMVLPNGAQPAPSLAAQGRPSTWFCGSC